MMRPVALIGYGAIAQEVCALADPAWGLQQVLVRPGKADAVQASLPHGIHAIETLDALHPDTGMVIECAGHGAVHDYGADILSRGIDLAIVSSGALADARLEDRLRQSAVEAGTRLRVLSGAIGGIDALAAAGAALENVSYIARKPPMSWSGSPAEQTHDLAGIHTETAVFEGTAREAALQFPKNANVVATVALAGVGFDRTTVALMADPQAQGNTHEITATGGGYDLRYATKGAALKSNPKTSALTAQSILQALRGRAPGIVV